VLVAGEVLAESVTAGAPDDDSLPVHEDADLGLTLWVRRR
jgi:hypothetical protein